MNDSIKKLALKIEGLLPNDDSPQVIYDKLTVLMAKQREYFSHKQPEDIVKLLFYIWSLKLTGNFDFGDKKLNSISFALLFQTSGNKHVAYCPDCEGDGEVTCDHCAGDEEITCGECVGDGSLYCRDCGGSGKRDDEDEESEDCYYCEGTGQRVCPECNGHGTTRCEYCNNGKEECPTCNGHGEVETEETDYESHFIVTWDAVIKHRCEITEGASEITMSEYDFDRLRDDYVTLDYRDDLHDNLEDFIIESEMYCPIFTDNPRMEFTHMMHLRLMRYNMKPYLN